MKRDISIEFIARTLAWLFWSIVYYLVVAFVALDFNPTHWEIYNRIMFAFSSFYSLVLAITYKKKKDKNDN